ncbi:MAG: calcium/sodium antiporter [Leptospiraceae bacterium]|nr:calcium/sodium antiporter [Leptospiraceae bacterium]
MLAGLAILFGLLLLLWSADRFIEGAASTARHFRISPLMIGMVVVGFGTSAPELLVSALASLQGNPGIALGNAYGSNITNIALILGITALISPVAVQSGILKKELPLLALITVVAVIQLIDGELSRLDAIILLVCFAGLMVWTIREGTRKKEDSLSTDMEAELEGRSTSLKWALIWLVVGLALLLVSSRMLVWGAVVLAQALRISDLIIGLTVVAVGTSLPELASSVMSARKGEHDLALGNILGSNLFNTLAVVGIAGSIHPLHVEPEVLYRDVLLMAGLTFSLFFLGFGFRGPGRINRWEGLALVLIYGSYIAYLVFSVSQSR